jgi:3-oxoacyl-[acyl-carrier-protein] synthase-3
MTQLRTTGIAGTGSYLPERVVDNAFFEGILDTNDEWIQQRTGIAQRRHVADGEENSHMCIKAAKQALEEAGIEASELDLIIVATISGDYQMPATACLVQHALGATNAGAFDVQAACSGFVTALSVGEAFVSSGRFDRVLIIGAEALSRFLDFEDRGSAILFGDGAGAAVLTPHSECKRGEIIKTTLGADGEGWDHIWIPSGGAKRPASLESVAEREHFIRVNGREVYRFAVKRMGEVIGEMMEGYEQSEIGLIVPHQVNQRIIDAAVERHNIPAEKVMVNINKYGNTSAASVPIALHEAIETGRMEDGKLVVLAAFGAGLTWAGALLRW